MKALVLYGPGNYKVENNWKEPELPEGWALIKVAYAGICGSDIPRFFTTGSYHHPMIIGHEFSGIVKKAAVNGKIKEGTPVAILPIIPCEICSGCRETGQPFHCNHYQFIGSRNDGGFAEYVAVPEKNLFCLSSKEELKTGAFIELLSVGLHVVRRSGIDHGKAIVFGAGPIGLSCALWLQFLGHEVTIVDVREFSLNIAEKMGLQTKRFDELGSEKEFDYAYEASGNNAAFIKGIQLLKDLGKMTVVGRNSKATTIPMEIFESMMRKENTINGCWGYNLKGDEPLMRKFLEKHDLSCMVSHEIQLEDIPEVLEQVVKPHGNYCKIMIHME